MTIDKKIFDTEKTDYSTPSLFLGSEPGLFDTVNKQYPKIWEMYKLMKKMDWDENEFNFSQCMLEFETCPKDIADIMIETLAWQWEADSLAARHLVPILAPFLSSSEATAAYSAVGTNEILHAATYSEIVRSSFKNPDEVLGKIIAITESFRRMETIASIMAETYRVGHLYALGMVDNCQETYNKLYMFLVAMLALERIQFMSSFSITFGIARSGWFVPIGKAVQKIAQDELEVHVELGKAVLNYEHQTERGRIARIQCADEIRRVIEEVTDAERTWNRERLFANGRELIGLNCESVDQWILFSSMDVHNFFGIQGKYDFPKKNPLAYMEEWLNISATQPAPQEESNGQYKMNIVVRDDEGEKFDTGF